MDGYNEYVTNDTKAQIKILAENYNNDKTYANFMNLVSNCPMGLELFMRVSTNYLKFISKEKNTS